MIKARSVSGSGSRLSIAAASVALAVAVLGVAGCGGSDGGGGDGHASNFVLLSFTQAGQDNLPLNRILRFKFSSAIDPASVDNLSIQIRKGSAFGESVRGVYRAVGSEVYFEPQLAGLCDFSDSGLEPNTKYRISVVGYPESFALRSIGGVPLNETTTYEVRTLAESDPALLEDQVPGVGPSVVSAWLTTDVNVPSAYITANGAAAISVQDGQAAVIRLSENVHPCSITDQTVLVYEYQRGDPTVFQPAPNGNASGFVTPTASQVDDATPGDYYTWGATNPGIVTLQQPQRVLATLELVQSFTGTELRIYPVAGRWPDDSMIAVDLTFAIEDFAGLPMTPHRFSFTTENEVVQASVRSILFEGETPIDVARTTASVNEPAKDTESKAQGFMLFAGDGDNGPNQLSPSKPETPQSLCALDRQPNDNVRDDFDPTTNVLFDTGPVNSCPNVTDGSNAVVWEFRSFRLKSGLTLRIVGANPAIILVLNDVTIETGATVLVRGDNSGGAPRGAGENGNGYYATNTYTNPTAAKGGIGVAGGGNGGDSKGGSATNLDWGNDGFAGFGSPQAGVQGGTGSGKGNTSSNSGNNYAYGASGSAAGGGGGGHAAKGADGQAVANANTPFDKAVRGQGGEAYPTNPTADRALVPSSGSGGGAGGFHNGPYSVQYGYPYYSASGGAGGAGGGFVDFTAAGNINVFGRIDAAGSRGGNGVAYYYGGSGGGGGGSGGGIRLLTPRNITLTGGVLTAVGGGGGTGGYPNAGSGPANAGGAGGVGRIALEDGDSLVTGLLATNVFPSEGNPGFYRDVFDPSRFKGGGLTPEVVTDFFFVGALDPQFDVPTAADFPETFGGVGPGPGAGIPAGASRGLGKTGILVEARGRLMTSEGEPDLTPAGTTAFYTVGYFKDSGQEDAPTWVPSAFPADIGPRPTDNAGDGIANLNGRSFFQVRITFYLPATVGPFDPGPFVNTWNLRFSSDQ